MEHLLGYSNNNDDIDDNDGIDNNDSIDNNDGIDDDDQQQSHRRYTTIPAFVQCHKISNQHKWICQRTNNNLVKKYINMLLACGIK